MLSATYKCDWYEYTFMTWNTMTSKANVDGPAGQRLIDSPYETLSRANLKVSPYES
jgi:hypothetical protein